MKDLIKIISALAIILIPLAAWLTHIIYCLKAASYLLLIAGGLVAPVGVIHGISIWFGAGW